MPHQVQANQPSNAKTAPEMFAESRALNQSENDGQLNSLAELALKAAFNDSPLEDLKKLIQVMRSLNERAAKEMNFANAHVYRNQLVEVQRIINLYFPYTETPNQPINAAAQQCHFVASKMLLKAHDCRVRGLAEGEEVLFDEYESVLMNAINQDVLGYGGAVDLATMLRMIQKGDKTFMLEDENRHQDILNLPDPKVKALVQLYKKSLYAIVLNDQNQMVLKILQTRGVPSDEQISASCEVLSDYFYKQKYSSAEIAPIAKDVMLQLIANGGWNVAKRLALKLAELGHDEAGNYLVQVAKGNDNIQEFGFLFQYYLPKETRDEIARDLRAQVRDKYCQVFLGVLPSELQDLDVLNGEDLKEAQNNPRALVERFEGQFDKKDVDERLAMAVANPQLNTKQRQDLCFVAAEKGYKFPASVYLKTLAKDDDKMAFRDKVKEILVQRKERLAQTQTRVGAAIGFSTLMFGAIGVFANNFYKKYLQSKEEAKLEEEKKRRDEEEKKAKEDKKQEVKKSKEQARLQEVEAGYHGLVAKSLKEIESAEEKIAENSAKIEEKLKGRFGFPSAYTPKLMEKEADAVKLRAEQKNHWQSCETIAENISAHRQFFANYKIAINAIFAKDAAALPSDLAMFEDAKAVINASSIEEKNAKLNAFLAKYSHKEKLQSVDSDLVTVSKIYDICKSRNADRQGSGAIGIVPATITSKEFEASKVYKLFGAEIGYDAKDLAGKPLPEKQESPSQDKSAEVFKEEVKEVAQPSKPKKAKPAPQPSAPEKSANKMREERQTSEAALSNPFFATALYQLRVLSEIESFESPDDKRQALWCIYRALGALANCGRGEINYENPQEYKIAPLGFGAVQREVIQRSAGIDFNNSRNYLRHEVFMADNIETGALVGIAKQLLEYLPDLEKLARGGEVFLDAAPARNIAEILQSVLQINTGQSTTDIEASVAQEEINRLMKELNSSENFASRLWICNSIAQLLKDSHLDKYIKDEDFRLVARSLGHSYASGDFVKQFVVEGEGIKNQHERRPYPLDLQNLEPISEVDIQHFIRCVEKSMKTPEGRVGAGAAVKQLYDQNLASRGLPGS